MGKTSGTCHHHLVPHHHISVRHSGECIQPVLWFGEDAVKVDDTHYIAEMAMPDKGWRAWFAEVHFTQGVGIVPYIFSTQVDILPDEFPFPPCEGANCKGTLL